MSEKYPYTDKRLLEQPNTYFYTTFRGEEFIDGWQENRLAVYTSDEESKKPTQCIEQKIRLDEIDTQLLLLNLINDGQEDKDYWIARLVKKFEVSKRLFSHYQRIPPHKPALSAIYDELDLYLLFGELLVKLTEENYKIQWVNTLLKVMDTLVSQQYKLTARQLGGLNWLLSMEKNIIHNVKSGML